MTIRRSEAAHHEIEHPVVRTHPETGRKGLYVNRNFTLRFKDMTVEESRPLLNFLWEHAVKPEFTCRFRWEMGSIAFWDNRCVKLRPQRLPRPAAGHAPRHGQRRPAVLTRLEDTDLLLGNSRQMRP